MTHAAAPGCKWQGDSETMDTTVTIILKSLEDWMEEGCKVNIIRYSDNVYRASIEEQWDAKWVTLYHADGTSMDEAIANLRQRVEVTREESAT